MRGARGSLPFPEPERDKGLDNQRATGGKQITVVQVFNETNAGAGPVPLGVVGIARVYLPSCPAFIPRSPLSISTWSSASLGHPRLSSNLPPLLLLLLLLRDSVYVFGKEGKRDFHP